MKARCGKCNSAIEWQHTRGARLDKESCSCGGKLSLMRRRTIQGPAPLPQFTRQSFGDIYHVIYTGGGTGEWLYDIKEKKFVRIEENKANI